MLYLRGGVSSQFAHHVDCSYLVPPLLILLPLGLGNPSFQICTQYLAPSLFPPVYPSVIIFSNVELSPLQHVIFSHLFQDLFSVMHAFELSICLSSGIHDLAFICFKSATSYSWTPQSLCFASTNVHRLVGE